jgi:hypothetical protein
MECRFVYPNGQHCRLRATTSHVFCRQHAPQPRVPTLRNRATPFRRWIDIRRALPTLDAAEIPAALLYVLSALLEEGPRPISDASAGMLLRALLRRLGSVPFHLPDDPAPEPDPSFALSQSIDRLIALTKSRAARLAASDTDVAIPFSLSCSVNRPLTLQTQQNERPSRTHTQGGGGTPVTDL